MWLSQEGYRPSGRGIGTLIELRPLAAFGGFASGAVGFFTQPWPLADFMGASMGPSAPELRLDVGLKLEHADVYVLTG